MSVVRCCGKELKIKHSDEMGDGQRLLAKYGDEYYIVAYQCRAVDGDNGHKLKLIWDHCLIQTPSNWCTKIGCTNMLCCDLHLDNRIVLICSVDVDVVPPNNQLTRAITAVVNHEKKNMSQKRKISDLVNENEQLREELEKCKKSRISDIGEIPIGFGEEHQNIRFIFDHNKKINSQCIHVVFPNGDVWLFCGFYGNTAKLISDSKIRIKCEISHCSRFCTYIHETPKNITINNITWKRVIEDVLCERVVKVG